MQPDEDILHDGRDITKRVEKLWDTAISTKNCRRNDVVSLMWQLGFGWCCIITMRDKQQQSTGATSGSAVMHPTTGYGT